MGKESSIQWTSASWNPWHGCKKISSGCKFCYMYRDKEKYGQDPTMVVRSKTKFYDPDKWKEPKLIFTCSWSDWFIDEADEWRPEAWAVIKRNPHHTFQVLTKRPERILDHLPDDWGDGYPNVWLGVSVEDQDAAYKRIPLLLDVPAQVRFLSCEPLLGPLELENYLYTRFIMGGDRHPHNQIKWTIIGGESGNDNGKYLYRRCSMFWIMNIVEQCQNANVPVFVKQLGTLLSKELKLKDRHGGDIDEFPEHLRIREFPKAKDMLPL